MMAEHTPGPWIIEDDRGRLLIWGPTDARGQTRLVVSHIPAHYEEGTRRDDQTLADARLIAAAPTLLAALKTAASGLKRMVASERRGPFKATVDGCLEVASILEEEAQEAIKQAS